MRRPTTTRALRLAVCIGVALAGLGVGSGGEVPGNGADVAPGAGTVLPDERVPAARIPVSGIIDEALRTSVVRRAAEAVRDGNRLLIFHITSDGGFLGDGLELSRDIERVARDGVRTVAYVDSKAYSAAAIAAFSCQEIAMSPEASIGACTPYAAIPLAGPQPMEEPVRAKMEGTVVERLESLAEKHGYPPALLKAMVTMETAVVEVTDQATGRRQYIEEQDLFRLGGEWQKGDIVVTSSEVLTVGAEKAKRYGLAQHIVRGFDDLYDVYPIEGRIAVYPVTWNETAVVWLNNMYLKALLVLLGLLGIYVELNTPGFGVPGTVGIVAFSILFAASFLAGEPGWLPPLLFLAGMVMLLAELFVTPGFGMLGGVGLALILASVILALPNLGGVPRRDYEWVDLYNSLTLTAGILVAFVVGTILLAKFLPSVPILGRLVLAPGTVSDGSSRGAAAVQEAGARLGDLGRAVSSLRPSGKARFGDRLADVVAEGEFLDAGTDVRVIEVRGNRVVVRPAGGEPQGETRA